MQWFHVLEDRLTGSFYVRAEAIDPAMLAEAMGVSTDAFERRGVEGYDHEIRSEAQMEAEPELAAALKAWRAGPLRAYRHNGQVCADRGRGDPAEPAHGLRGGWHAGMAGAAAENVSACSEALTVARLVEQAAEIARPYAERWAALIAKERTPAPSRV
jgi:hypothetical protein